jgi:exonuclease III
MSVKNMINLCSLNVNGLQNRERRGRAIEWVKSMKCDIAYFQETHFDQNIENEINFNTDFNVYGILTKKLHHLSVHLIKQFCHFHQ